MRHLKVSVLQDPEVRDHMFLSISVVVTWTKHNLLMRMMKTCWGFKEKIHMKEEMVTE